MAQMAQGCPLNLTEISIVPGDYTISEFFNACQTAAGSGNNKWFVLAKNPTVFLGANGSANDATTSVFIVNNNNTYDGIQRSTGRGNTGTNTRTVSSDDKFYLYTW